MSASNTAKRYIAFLSLVLVSVFILSTETRAEMNEPWWEWGIVENNSKLYEQYAEYLSVEVTDPGDNQVLFTFSNTAPSDPSELFSSISITGLYFEDGSLLGLATILDKDSDPLDPSLAGLDFTTNATPPNLPGWSTLDPKFDATSAFSVSSNNGSPDGINAGESMGLLFNISDTFADVIDALNLGFTNPDGSPPRESLRIGIRVQGIGEESDSFILTPIPTSVILGMLGLGVAGLKLRKFA